MKVATSHSNLIPRLIQVLPNRKFGALTFANLEYHIFYSTEATLIMASLNITQEELKAVEQTRQRLFQLSNSIGSLKADVYASKPLPNL
jgi:hypothetical protein